MKKKKYKNQQVNAESDFGTLPTFLSDKQLEAIENADLSQALDEKQKAKLEWLAEKFGLIPVWKKEGYKSIHER